MMIANVRTISEKTKTEYLVMCQKSDCVNLILKKGGAPCVGCVTLTFYLKVPFQKVVKLQCIGSYTLIKDILLRRCITICECEF